MVDAARFLSAVSLPPAAVRAARTRRCSASGASQLLGATEATAGVISSFRLLNEGCESGPHTHTQTHKQPFEWRCRALFGDMLIETFFFFCHRCSATFSQISKGKSRGELLLGLLLIPSVRVTEIVSDSLLSSHQVCFFSHQETSNITALSVASPVIGRKTNRNHRQQKKKNIYKS